MLVRFIFLLFVYLGFVFCAFFHDFVLILLAFVFET